MYQKPFLLAHTHNVPHQPTATEFWANKRQTSQGTRTTTTKGTETQSKKTTATGEDMLYDMYHLYSRSI